MTIVVVHNFLLFYFIFMTHMSKEIKYGLRMALRASGGVCAGKMVHGFGDFATTAVGVFSPRKLARFYHGSWHADTNESKKK